MAFASDELTTDGFLGGRIVLSQPRSGYRAGIDPVLLAAAVPAAPGQSVLDLGCGAGAAVLCLGRRVGGLVLAGLELQPAYAALARRNAAINGVAAEVIEGDVTRMPASLKARRFDHVIANPPYFDRSRGTQASDPGREIALGEGAALSDWVEAGARRLAPRGRLTMIQRADRLPELLAAFAARLGGIGMMPIHPREGRDATLVIVSGVKGGGAPFRILPRLVLHDGAGHLRDGDDYASWASGVLRDGAALEAFGR